MENNQSELKFEQKRLQETIALAKMQIEQAKNANEENKKAIIEAKKELRENTSHSISNLWGSEGFEALADLNQFANPVTDKIIDYEETEKKILQLENIVKAPYFARIDFRFEGEAESEKIYIGRSSLKKEGSYDMDVYDWRSPIASVFYRFVLGKAYYDAPAGKIEGEVHLKRQYEIQNSILEFFFDADIQIVDEFLRKLLSQNTSDKMKSIIETIQREQDSVIRDMENDLMMVQGTAGSGKTSVALHRAAYLMYRGLSAKLTSENIVIISPNSIFEQYISNVLPELGEENVVSIIFEEIMKRILRKERIQSRNQLLERMMTDEFDGSLKKSSLEFKTSGTFIVMMNRFVEDIPYRWLFFEDFYYEGQCIAKKETLRKKIIARQEIPIGVKLKQLADYIIEKIGMIRQNRVKKSEEVLIQQEIQKFTKLNLEELYRNIFENKEYFYQLAEEMELPDKIEKIRNTASKNLERHILPYDDAIVLTYLEIKINGNSAYKNIKQVVIDEVQDYYPMHFEIFKLLFANANYTVLGDINQTLEKKEDMSLYEHIANTFQKKKSTLITLDKSFRCTNEILDFSARFIEEGSEVKGFQRKGDKPQIYIAENQMLLADKLVEEIKFCKEKGYRSIGLLTKSQKNAQSIFQLLNEKTEISLIKEESMSELNGAFVMPIYLSKGLEFDAVLICDAENENYNSQDDKKLLYIASTRALHRLNVFCEGEVSLLL